MREEREAGPEGRARPHESGGRLLRLGMSCPSCGAPPAVRVTELGRAALARLQREARIGTYQCQRRGCGCIYEVLAGAVHDAS